ncbi:hypothetical protein EV198_2785 [Roseivirga ehrenbergii]|uniref:Uncharacterized protein n=1 Tax=Roseivirga ehrenbergii (strain DSM 102268 / JCM 13514 / KCTC 12282 / NCIMB 14502 / KMM 6017) TaxID=279360 RepID=A0A150XTU6_ROSEK|nr:hypothetical protein [Roseivirga ehrenbergii]KYG82167.1 hypothetical protein MB14_01860 [Roseivirga ehrenbergii]TCL01993.1 hypothetical protein EV198_2785 [Roseivirga ehrenbergii]
MSYKLKQESISSFSTATAATICTEFFAGKNKISGESIMSLTDVRQVNSFIIEALFTQWQAEMARLRSPYFNYEAEEVQIALKEFMNTLSNHISIGRGHLEPLLSKAIEATILLTFAPKKFLLSHWLDVNKENLPKGKLRYIKTYTEGFKLIFETAKTPINPAYLGNLFDSMSSHFEIPEPIEFLQKLKAEDKLDLLFEKEVVNKPAPAPTHTPEIEETPEVINTVASKHENGKETINDRFNGSTTAPTLAEKLQKSNRQPLEKTLTLNERIMFTKTLFEGNQELMTKVLEELDTANSMDEALAKTQPYNKKWDIEGDEMDAFIQVLKRRFN